MTRAELQRGPNRGRSPNFGQGSAIVRANSGASPRVSESETLKGTPTSLSLTSSITLS
jgi:hypothetical protein